MASFLKFQAFDVNHWKAIGLISVHWIRENLFLLNFGFEDGKHNALNGGSLTFNNRPLLLKEWKSSMDFGMDVVKKVPVWIKLPILPLVFWQPLFFSKIGSVLGKPLIVDQVTTQQQRLGYARISVKIDINGPFPPSVKLVDERKYEYVQWLEYEWICVKCSNFQKHGHNADKCRVGRQQEGVSPKAVEVVLKREQVVTPVYVPVVESNGMITKTSQGDDGCFESKGDGWSSVILRRGLKSKGSKPSLAPRIIIPLASSWPVSFSEMCANGNEGGC
ncbi:uncharacterized protein [Rutidosis leptorrhynchoides]|uniref:uncharacterized protein n=1 Tax=Rutidosis leptorrhynchoides TaxID=125765 RepID=UPI003A99C05B